MSAPTPSSTTLTHRKTTATVLDAATFDALASFAETFGGELRIDPLARMLYATDASLYAEEPYGVAYPRGREDVIELMAFAAVMDLPLIPRTAGTSLAGQCVGRGLVVDVSRHMNAILEVNVEARWARVQPGVILDELNHALAEHGLMFGPDTSTSNRCMIGGMIGNNSCGSHSILYGNTMAHTLEVEAVLSDGSVARFGAVTVAELEERCGRGGREGEVYRRLRSLVGEHREEILARYPRPEVLRRNMGYPLDALAHTEVFEEGGERWNLAKFLCGTEGTLALTTEARVNLVPTPRCKRIVAAHFNDLDESLRATVVAVQHDPAAVELIDRRTFDATRDNLEQQRNREWIEGDPTAALVIEFYRDTPEELDAACEGLVEDYRARGMGYAFPIIDGAEMGKVWALRKAGLGVLMGIPGDVKPITFVEDTAVAVADLPEYIRRFSQILARYQTQCVYYAHASVGELHLRPELNPKDLGDIEKMKGIAVEVAELVRGFGGSISGEHGDGRVRSPLIEQMLGAEVYEMLREVKAAFDPQGILNPGKIVDPAPIDASLRYPPGRPVPEIETYFAYSEDGGLLRAVERCNGVGACRKLVFSGGTMCPSYMVTRDEQHTTRGRANAFRMLLLGERPEDAWESRELHDALDLCLGCKGCKSECPASVDMAKLKSEFLQHHHDHRGASLRTRFFGDPLNGYRLARQFAGMSNAFTRSRLGKALLSKLLGVHPARELPPFARRTLRQQLAKRTPHPNAGRHGEVIFFIDMFIDYNEPHIGLAAIDLIERAGWHARVIDHAYSGRTQLSKGLVRQARDLAEENTLALVEHARRGTPIVGIEPSAILTLIDEVPELVRAEHREAAREVATQIELVDDFLARIAAEGRCDLEFTPQDGQRVVLHGHCHQKALVGCDGTLAALRLVPGWTVEKLATGCCGMAGSFGYEVEHYELSMAVGELALFPAVRDAGAQTLIAAPGTSCRHQIHDGTGRDARHPLELLRAALVEG